MVLAGRESTESIKLFDTTAVPRIFAGLPFVCS